MGVAPSSPTLPVMSCEELATLAEENNKKDVAGIVRENGIDGAMVEGLDDEVLGEICPKKIHRLQMTSAMKQLTQYFEKLNASEGGGGGGVREHGAAAGGGGGSLAERRSWEVGTWKILPVSYIMGLSTEHPLLECRKLMDAGVLQTVKATEDELLQGGGAFESILILGGPEAPGPGLHEAEEAAGGAADAPRHHGSVVGLPVPAPGRQDRRGEALLRRLPEEREPAVPARAGAGIPRQDV